MMEYEVVPNKDIVDNYIFKAALLQCGTTEEKWMSDNKLKDNVAKRIGELQLRYSELSAEKKRSGFEAIEEYLKQNGRL